MADRSHDPDALARALRDLADDLRRDEAAGEPGDDAPVNRSIAAFARAVADAVEARADGETGTDSVLAVPLDEVLRMVDELPPERGIDLLEDVLGIWRRCSDHEVRRAIADRVGRHLDRRAEALASDPDAFARAVLPYRDVLGASMLVGHRVIDELAEHGAGPDRDADEPDPVSEQAHALVGDIADRVGRLGETVHASKLLGTRDATDGFVASIESRILEPTNLGGYETLVGSIAIHRRLFDFDRRFKMLGALWPEGLDDVAGDGVPLPERFDLASSVFDFDSPEALHGEFAFDPVFLDVADLGEPGEDFGFGDLGDLEGMALPEFAGLGELGLPMGPGGGPGELPGLGPSAVGPGGRGSDSFRLPDGTVVDPGSLQKLISSLPRGAGGEVDSSLVASLGLGRGGGSGAGGGGLGDLQRLLGDLGPRRPAPTGGSPSFPGMGSLPQGGGRRGPMRGSGPRAPQMPRFGSFGRTGEGARGGPGLGASGLPDLAGGELPAYGLGGFGDRVRSRGPSGFSPARPSSRRRGRRSGGLDHLALGFHSNVLGAEGLRGGGGSGSALPASGLRMPSSGGAGSGGFRGLPGGLGGLSAGTRATGGAPASYRGPDLGLGSSAGPAGPRGTWPVGLRPYLETMPTFEREALGLSTAGGPSYGDWESMLRLGPSARSGSGGPRIAGGFQPGRGASGIAAGAAGAGGFGMGRPAGLGGRRAPGGATGGLRLPDLDVDWTGPGTGPARAPSDMRLAAPRPSAAGGLGRRLPAAGMTAGGPRSAGMSRRIAPSGGGGGWPSRGFDALSRPWDLGGRTPSGTGVAGLSSRTPGDGGFRFRAPSRAGGSQAGGLATGSFSTGDFRTGAFRAAAPGAGAFSRSFPDTPAGSARPVGSSPGLPSFAGAPMGRGLSGRGMRLAGPSGGGPSSLAMIGGGLGTMGPAGPTGAPASEAGLGLRLPTFSTRTGGAPDLRMLQPGRAGGTALRSGTRAPGLAGQPATGGPAPTGFPGPAGPAGPAGPRARRGPVAGGRPGFEPGGRATAGRAPRGVSGGAGPAGPVRAPAPGGRGQRAPRMEGIPLGFAPGRSGARPAAPRQDIDEGALRNVAFADRRLRTGARATPEGATGPSASGRPTTGAGMRGMGSGVHPGAVPTGTGRAGMGPGFPPGAASTGFGRAGMGAGLRSGAAPTGTGMAGIGPGIGPAAVRRGSGMRGMGPGFHPGAASTGFGMAGMDAGLRSGAAPTGTGTAPGIPGAPAVRGPGGPATLPAGDGPVGSLVRPTSPASPGISSPTSARGRTAGGARGLAMPDGPGPAPSGGPSGGLAAGATGIPAGGRRATAGRRTLAAGPGSAGVAAPGVAGLDARLPEGLVAPPTAPEGRQARLPLAQPGFGRSTSGRGARGDGGRVLLDRPASDESVFGRTPEGRDLAELVREHRGAGRRIDPSLARVAAPDVAPADLGGVRVHTDELADLATRRAGTPAFSLGRDVFVRPDRFDPSSPEGLELLGHELRHSLQPGEMLRRQTDPGTSAAERAAEGPSGDPELEFDWDDRQAFGFLPKGLHLNYGTGFSLDLLDKGGSLNVGGGEGTTFDLESKKYRDADLHLSHGLFDLEGEVPSWDPGKAELDLTFPKGSSLRDFQAGYAHSNRAVDLGWRPTDYGMKLKGVFAGKEPGGEAEFSYDPIDVYAKMRRWDPSQVTTGLRWRSDEAGTFDTSYDLGKETLHSAWDMKDGGRRMGASAVVPTGDPGSSRVGARFAEGPFSGRMEVPLDQPEMTTGRLRWTEDGVNVDVAANKKKVSGRVGLQFGADIEDAVKLPGRLTETFEGAARVPGQLEEAGLDPKAIQKIYEENEKRVQSVQRGFEQADRFRSKTPNWGFYLEGGVDVDRETGAATPTGEAGLLVRFKESLRQGGDGTSTGILPASSPAARAVGTSRGEALGREERSILSRAIGSTPRDVRLHTDGPARRASRRMGAEAFTVGRDVYMDRESFDRSRDLPLLAHEVSHASEPEPGSRAQAAAAEQRARSYERQMERTMVRAEVAAPETTEPPVEKRPASDVPMEQVDIAAAQRAASNRSIQQSEGSGEREQAEESALPMPPDAGLEPLVYQIYDRIKFHLMIDRERKGGF